MADEATSLENAAKIIGINLNRQPNRFSNGWPDRLPLNDIAKLQFPDDEGKQKELIQQVKNYIEHNTFEVDSHYCINDDESDNPIISAGAFNYYCSFLTLTNLNDITLDWLKAQNWPNHILLKEVENRLDDCLDYELICRYWANGKKLFDELYNENELREKIIAAIQNDTLRAKVERDVKKDEQINTRDGFIEVIDKYEIRKIKKGYLGNNYVRITINNADFYGWLLRTNQWPLHEGCLLNCWWDEQLHTADPKEHLEALDDMYARISNGKAINWNYWANREFSSFQAARLVKYIDPIEWVGNDYKQGKIPDDLLKEMKRLEEWLNQKSQTWKFDTLKPAIAEYSAIADKPINPPFGMEEVSRKTHLIEIVRDNESQAEAISSEATIQPRKKLKPHTRDRNEGLLLIYEIIKQYEVNYLDDLKASKAWGKIISEEFTSNTIKSISQNKREVILSGGDKLDKSHFCNKYRKRFQ